MIAMRNNQSLDPMRWQVLARALLPEIFRVLFADEQWNPGCSDSLMQFFFVLTPVVKQAHLSRDEEFLFRVHAFADWCMRQPEQEIFNPAGVAFYENLFDDRPHDEAISWISPTVFADIEELLGFRLGAERFAKVKAAYAKRTSFNDRKYASVIAQAERQMNK